MPTNYFIDVDCRMTNKPQTVMEKAEQNNCYFLTWWSSAKKGVGGCNCMEHVERMEEGHLQGMAYL